MVTGADEGPREGESDDVDRLDAIGGEAREERVFGLAARTAGRTCLSRSCAAGRHLAHLRDSVTHCAMLTGSLGQGAKKLGNPLRPFFLFARGQRSGVDAGQGDVGLGARPPGD